MTVVQPSRMRELSREQALRLLGYGAYLGRVAFLHGGSPIILPINYLYDEPTAQIVFRTRPGSALEAMRGQRVAFEVDSNRPLDRAGWSVLVRGRAGPLADDAAAERLGRGPLRAWAWYHADLWYAITIDEVSGRQVGGTP